MIKIIQEHMARYPEMEIRDIFKLIYQSEFGGGHMIKDKNASLEWIKKEYEFIQDQRSDQTDEEKKWLIREAVCEEIGDGIVRVYLDALGKGLSPETLNELFVLSANEKRGSITRLEAKLDMFLDLCKAGEIPFEEQEVRRKIEAWKEAGYSAMHHSEAFRQHYFPAYRIVLKKYAERLNVFAGIDRCMREKTETRPVVVAIEGGAGSGKSVLGGIIKEVYHCNLFHMDDFFLQMHQRTPERFAEPGGNVDYERFKIEVLDQLDHPDGLWYQKYDCGTQSLKEKEFVSYDRLVVIEGAYSLHPHFEDRADLAFFLEIPDEVQLERIRNRNGEWMLKRFVKEWIPMERTYFEEFKIREKEYCQVIK